MGPLSSSSYKWKMLKIRNQNETFKMQFHVYQSLNWKMYFQSNSDNNVSDNLPTHRKREIMDIKMNCLKFIIWFSEVSQKCISIIWIFLASVQLKANFTIEPISWHSNESFKIELSNIFVINVPKIYFISYNTDINTIIFKQ